MIVRVTATLMSAVLLPFAACASGSLGSTPRHSPRPLATVSKAGAKPFVFPQMPAAFVTLRPTTTLDVFDPADLLAPGTGRLSLREAFALANRLNVEAAIVLERGAVYRLERCGPFEDAPDETNELVHTANQTLTVNGNAATIFQDCDGAGVIVQQGGNSLLNLVDFSVAGGRSRHSPAGGIWSSGTGEVRITNSVVVDNQVYFAGPAAALSAGGVVSNGEVIVSGATFAMNRSDQGVGAIAAAASVKVIKSSFYENVGQAAGAIAGGKGGAPVPAAGPPPFTGRTPPGVTLVYSTFNANGSPAIRVTGGTLTSFASAIAAAGAGPLCESAPGQTNSLGYNVSSGGGGCGFGSAPGDRINAPKLRFQKVTGMKQVMVFAPAAGSPLLDAIKAPDCVPAPVRSLFPVYSGGSSDQLGVPRPQGTGCDIGAIEFIHNGSLNRRVTDPPPSDLPLPTRWAPPALGLGKGASIVRVDTDQDSVEPGKLSLREAFDAANRSSQDTTIVLEPRRTYRLTRCVAPQSAADNESNDLVYAGTTALRLEGNGSAIVQTCDGSGVLAIFSDSRFTLNGVTIAGGRSVIHPGGGIYMAGAGELRLESSWVTDNTTVAAGGGIASFGDVTLLDSTISDNHSAEVGGGIIGTADVTAVDSSLFDNTAALAIGAIGNHSGKLTLLFTTIAHNTAPNVAVGSLASFGSMVADYLPPAPPPGGVPAETASPPPGPGMGGFPPPANCAVEHPGAAMDGNFATDRSCGFTTVGTDPLLTPNRRTAPTYLIPGVNSPAARLVPSTRCAPYRGTVDQSGAPRGKDAGCTGGAIEAR